MNSNVIELFRRLAAQEVEFVVIGGVAAVMLGVAYVTQDIDICYNPEPSNIDRLIQALSPLRPRLRVHGMTDEEAQALPFHLNIQTMQQTEIMTLSVDAAELDIMHFVPGVGNFTKVRQASILVPLPGFEVLVLDLPALIESKRAAGRTKDLFILPQIEATLRLREEEDSSQA